MTIKRTLFVGLVLSGILLLSACDNSAKKAQQDGINMIPDQVAHTTPDQVAHTTSDQVAHTTSDQVAHTTSDQAQKDGNNTTAAQGDDNVLDSANAQGLVIDFSDDGFTAYRTEVKKVADGMTMVTRKDRDETFTVSYKADTVFQIYEGNNSTSKGELKEAAKDAVLRDSSVHLWGSMEGNVFVADRVVVWKTVW